MRMNKFAFLLGLVITAILFAEVAAHADTLDRYTKLTFSEPIAIPGQVLPAGTYVFRLPLDHSLNLVQITNVEGTRVYATLNAISTERAQRTGDTVLVLADQKPGTPEALVKWFYPGDINGQQFVYPKAEEQQLAAAPQETVNATEAGD